MKKLNGLLVAGSAALAPTFITGPFDITHVGKDGMTFQKRVPSLVRWPEGGGPPDTIFEQTWSCEGGNLVLKRERKGQVIEHQASEETVWSK